jgi:hypothetical protein
VAKKQGFSLSEIDEMDIPFLLDILVEFTNAAYEHSPDKVHRRQATQTDFDCF